METRKLPQWMKKRSPRELERELELGGFRNARVLRQHIAVRNARKRFPLPKPQENLMPEQISQITKVERMLKALLSANNQLHWIGGYVYGRTSNDDPFVILYPAAPYLNNKICRVYKEQFNKLPDFIQTDNVPPDTDSNPDKDKAQNKGIYHPCPMFQIVIYDGRDTQMGPEKRFGDVLAITDKMPEGGMAVPANGSQPPPPPVRDTRGAQAPQAQAGRKGGTPQTPEWEFYTAVWRGNAAIYQSAKQVKNIADKICPTWQHGKSPADDVAMGNALATYAKTGADLRDAKKDGATCHNEALKKAVATYTAVAEGV